MFAELPDMMDAVSTRPSHCLTTVDNGEVYLEATELELDRSRSSYLIPERLKWLLENGKLLHGFCVRILHW